MDILYYKDPVGNFGDDLNEWLWDHIIPSIYNIKSEYTILGVGSILNKHIIKNKKVIVLGSGIAYGDLPDKEQLKILCVRGKLSAHVLDIDESLAITDTAILLRLLPEFTVIPEDKRDGIIFIPHHKTFESSDWKEVCEKSNIELINPSEDTKYIINKIRHAKLVIAEAMHAAIIADAMRVNWIPVVASNEINTFKWLDWLSNYDIEYTPIYIGLPDLTDERVNRLKIKYGVCAYKPNYKNMGIEQLYKAKEGEKLSSFQKKLFKLNLKIVKRLKTSQAAKNKHQERLIKNLSNIKISKPYLSTDKKFYKKLDLMKYKVDELLITLSE